MSIGTTKLKQILKGIKTMSINEYNELFERAKQMKEEKEYKRFSKNYPACRNCKNLKIDKGSFFDNYSCLHYKEKSKPKKLSSYTLATNYKFKPKSCKAFESKNKMATKVRRLYKYAPYIPILKEPIIFK